MLYYFRIIEADAYVLSVCECGVLLKQAVGQSAAIRHPSLREIEGDWCCVAECREVSHAVACHDVNIKSDVPPTHTVEEGVFGRFEVVSHVSLMNNVPSIHPFMTWLNSHLSCLYVVYLLHSCRFGHCSLQQRSKSLCVMILRI